ncbi:hypothetical protein ACLHDG_07850 [Sulfurovum sp. CS9]|uniref:hypothetical protein n=1 Tax=Sulfurovum sp. CS9 TaxID=3391146 RepID=UPI0039ED9B85
MKNLTLPPYNDNILLGTLSRNTRLGSHPLLLQNLQQILTQYNLYQQHGGNPWNLNIITIPTALEDSLEAHYTRPPNALGMIKVMRDEVSPDVCPMCGSLFTSELDHFLPQEDYPWFTVLTKNLIPACKCNRLKGTIVQGTNNTQHFLHPYYANCLNNRLITCTIVGQPNYFTPSISLNNYIGAAVGNCSNGAINFHIDELIKKTNILNFLDKKWAKLVHDPSSIIMTFPDTVINTIPECRNYIQNSLNRWDRQLGTPNNWMSILFSGILNNAAAIDWIYHRHNAIV